MVLAWSWPFSHASGAYAPFAWLKMPWMAPKQLSRPSVPGAHEPADEGGAPPWLGSALLADPYCVSVPYIGKWDTTTV